MCATHTHILESRTMSVCVFWYMFDRRLCINFYCLIITKLCRCRWAHTISSTVLLVCKGGRKKFTFVCRFRVFFAFLSVDFIWCNEIFAFELKSYLCEWKRNEKTPFEPFSFLLTIFICVQHIIWCEMWCTRFHDCPIPLLIRHFNISFILTAAELRNRQKNKFFFSLAFGFCILCFGENSSAYQSQSILSQLMHVLNLIRRHRRK